ncbi:MAG TPA: efflux RND transporter periplasmic adaptor subunit [Saprospirales bacterium]|nr:efflux RND transporter periplasmic adaptor subunit [Saprospirales bacterium]
MTLKCPPNNPNNPKFLLPQNLKLHHNMKNKALLSILALAALTFAACGGGGSKDPAAKLAALKDKKSKLETQISELEKQVNAETPAARKVKTVGLTQLSTAPFRHYIDLQGKVEAEESVMATAKMPGSLKRVLVKNGDNVKRGQLLAEIDDAVMVKSLAELEGQLVTATDIYNRQKGLWDQKIGTEVAYIQAKNGKESLERSIATIKEQWSMTKIYAPQSGTVDMVMLRQGQAIAPGVPLCNILNLTNLKIVGNVTEAYAAKVRKGDQVQVFFPDLDKEITTRITYVSKSINPMTRTFSVECALPGGSYSANQVAVMKIVDYQSTNAISIPVNLIQTAEDGDFVMAVDKTGEKAGTAKKLMVKQGQNYNGQVEILSGLKKGDWVISTGFQEVNNGEAVAF